jgi:hypothetical protein
VIETGRPPFLRHLQNRWVIEGGDATSTIVHSTLSYRSWWALPLAPFIALLMKKTVKPLLAQFRDAVQTRHQEDPGTTRPALPRAV